MKSFKWVSLFAVLSCVTASLSWAESMKTLTRRSGDAAQILVAAVIGPQAQISSALIEKSQCIATVSNLITGGIIIGGRHGNGLVSCRLSGGGWSNPSFMNLSGGSFGLQLGLDSTDLVFLFFDQDSAEQFSTNYWTMSGVAQVTPGPLGKNAKVDNYAHLKGSILGYSRAKGLFIGLTLNGTSFNVDHGANKAIYGKRVTARDILFNSASKAPSPANVYLEALEEVDRSN